MGNQQQIAYGQAGGKGQGLTRFQVAGDPSPNFPLWAAGSMNLTMPAHLLDAKGGAYRYGKTKVGGITNLYCDGQVLRPLLIAGTGLSGAPTPRNLLLGGVGAGNYDCILHGRQSAAFQLAAVGSVIAAGDAGIVVNGEWINDQTTTVANALGAYKEAFTFAASTLTVANGATGITATLANAFTTAAALTGPYVYTPNFLHPRPGDIIEIVDTGPNSRFFRLSAISGNTATIFPAYTGPGGAGLTYRLWRTGYGSWSHAVMFYNGNTRVVYYAGNTLNSGTDDGTIEAIVGLTATHSMSPWLVDSATPPVAVAELHAVDVAYYKGYLLYGDGPLIGWSIAPFPSAFPFGTNDFPAKNQAIINATGKFLYYEQIGDQLFAFFEDNIYLVSATGVIPEFTVYKLPEVSAPLLPGISDPQISPAGSAMQYTRPSCSGRGTVYYLSESGVQQMAGTTPKRISIPVETYDHVAADDSYQLAYDRALDALLWSDSGGQRALIYQPDFDHWFQLDLSALGEVRGIGPVAVPEPSGSYPQRIYRASSLAYWANGSMYTVSPRQVDLGSLVTSLCPWILATPIASCGDIYDGFQFGGLRVIARGPTGSSPSLTWTVYDGSNPYVMAARDTGSFAYGDAMASSANLLGGKLDGAFVAVVLTGTSFIELAGVAIYPVQDPSRR